MLVLFRRMGVIEKPEDVFDWVKWWGYDRLQSIHALSAVSGTGDQELASLIEWLEEWKVTWRANPLANGISLPIYYVQREAELAAWQERLRAESDYRTPTVKRFVLWGIAGVGKTVLAQALALDEEMNEYFRNGVLWATLGPEQMRGEKIGQILVTWCRQLGLPVEAEDTPEMLHARVKEKLSDPTVRVLIVLDDVWWAEDVKLLLVDGSQSRVLITTRMVSVAQKLGWDNRNQIIALPVMSEAESLELIRCRMGDDWRDEMTANAGELAHRVGHLPLAIELGVTVAKRRGWPFLLTRLREGKGMDTLRRWPEEGRQDSLRRSLDLSYAVLDDKARGLLMELTKLVPGPMFTTTDLGTADARWNMEQWEWEDALQQLVDAAMVESVESGLRYHLHPMVSAYACAKSASEGCTELRESK